MKYTNTAATAQDRTCQIQIFQPTLLIAMPPAKTVMNENSHWPKHEAAAPMWRYFSGAISGPYNLYLVNFQIGLQDEEV